MKKMGIGGGGECMQLTAKKKQLKTTIHFKNKLQKVQLYSEGSTFVG